MNPKRLILAIVAVFVGVWITDFLIHGVLLKNDYAATMSLWRPEAEMQANMGWMMLGQLLVATAFVILYAKGFAAKAHLGCACLYGLCMGLFHGAGMIIMYAVQPLPASLTAKWFVIAIVQAVLLGALAFFVYKPKPAESKS